jgi:hypothetical protein
MSSVSITCLSPDLNGQLRQLQNAFRILVNQNITF